MFLHLVGIDSCSWRDNSKRTGDAIQEGDYIGAAIEAAAGVLGIVPAVGDAAGELCVVLHVV